LGVVLGDEGVEDEEGDEGGGEDVGVAVATFFSRGLFKVENPITNVFRAFVL
jgi:hypothetical protein